MQILINFQCIMRKKILICYYKNQVTLTKAETTDIIQINKGFDCEKRKLYLNFYTNLHLENYLICSKFDNPLL